MHMQHIKDMATISNNRYKKFSSLFINPFIASKSIYAALHNVITLSIVVICLLKALNVALICPSSITMFDGRRHVYMLMFILIDGHAGAIIGYETKLS